MRMRIARLSLVAALVAPSAGCDIAAGSRQAAGTPQAAPHAQPANGRYQVDPERNRVWFLTHEGVLVLDASRPERVRVSVPDWVWAGGSFACPPALALGPRGEAVITSNVLPTIWRIDPDSFAVSEHPLQLDADRDRDVGFAGLIYSRQHGAFLAVSQLHGSLWRIDPLLSRAQKIALSSPLPEACGLAERPRAGRPSSGRLADLCVRTGQGDWSVVFAPHGRSAHVSAVPCNAGPGPMAAAGMRAEAAR